MGRIVTAIVLSSCLAAPACADLILSGTIIANALGESAGFPVDGLTNQAGLSPGFNSGVDDFATAVAANTHAHNSGDWASAASTFTGSIDIDLGGSFLIAQLAMWNALVPTDNNDRHINSFTVFTDTQSDFSAATNVGGFFNPQSVAGINATTFDVTDTTGRYLRVQINSNHGDPNVTQMGEFAVGVVPEPSAFLFGGLACSLVGLVQCRRKLRSFTDKQVWLVANHHCLSSLVD